MIYFEHLRRSYLDELTQWLPSMSVEINPTQGQILVRYIGLVLDLINDSFTHFNFKLASLLDFRIKIKICDQFYCFMYLHILLQQGFQNFLLSKTIITD